MPQTFLLHDDAINRFNAHYFIASNGDKTVICEDNRPIDRPSRMRMMAPAEFCAKFAHMVVGNGQRGGIQNAARYWIEDEKARRYNDLRFEVNPDKSDRVADAYNLFRGFPLRPDASKPWPRIEHFLREIIAAGDPNFYTFILQWLAWIRRKSDQTCLGLALRSGAKGTGKGTFAELTRTLIGPANFQPVQNGEYFTGRFNGLLEQSIVVFVDEAVWSGDRKANSILKALITEPYLVVERKRQEACTVRNYCHMLVASNDEWFINVEPDDRRWVISDVSEVCARNVHYFGALRDEIASGGAAGLLAHLMTIELPRIMEQPNDSYQAQYSANQQFVRSLRGVGRYLYGRLREGSTFAGRDEGVWLSHVSRNEWYDDYLKEAEATQGRGYNVSREAFVRDVAEIIPIQQSRGWSGDPRSRPYMLDLPPLEDAREAAAGHWRRPQLFAGADDPL